ncbi:zinc transporter ZntB [Aestuariicoccus sp. MJ-SS9]|uniref:zinc transporter ZntB n=1 Tax=Aestuariicoccus sp. MJ-SS9 TaxID=3079855 RepID=UPI00290F9CDC|nr:zinc transporter ZntB [Aestuariicoccus sp. MJ-SS9]MDU8913575.1 zinc transporter ZntB [Aestuariicoccus sp. MJ-SS9]
MSESGTTTYLLDGRGGARAVSADALTGGALPGTGGGFVWGHLSRGDADTWAELERWGLEPVVIEALMADETRPRCTLHGEGVYLNLRGVNLNPGAEPEDMISVRLWLDPHRVIGVWGRPLQAMTDMVAAFERGQAPVSPGDLVAKLALRLADRAEPSVAELNARIDDLEEAILDPEGDVIRSELADLRRTAIVLRRYFVPQRDALTTLEIEDLPWLTDRDRIHIREAAERVLRFGEELDAIRDRAQVVHDQIMDMRAERMNQRMLVLSVVASIFLPLGLVTGLLGMNVGGIPGTASPWGFAAVCGGLVVIGLGLLLWFRRMGLFR